MHAGLRKHLTRGRPIESPNQGGVKDPKPLALDNELNSSYHHGEITLFTIDPYDGNAT